MKRRGQQREERFAHSSGRGALVYPCLAANLRTLEREVSAFYDRQLGRARLSVTQYTILRVASEFPTRNQRQLAALLAIDASTLTRNLKPLLRNRFLEASASSSRAGSLLALTSRGRRALRDGTRLWLDAQKEMKARLGAREWRRLQQATIASLHSLLEK